MVWIDRLEDGWMAEWTPLAKPSQVATGQKEEVVKKVEKRWIDDKQQWQWQWQQQQQWQWQSVEKKGENAESAQGQKSEWGMRKVNEECVDGFQMNLIRDQLCPINWFSGIVLNRLAWFKESKDRSWLTYKLKSDQMALIRARETSLMDGIDDKEYVTLLEVMHR